MPPQLSKDFVVGHKTLLDIADLRWREGEVLKTSGLPQGAVYLAGYAIECLLKAVICKTLDLDRLPATFKSHDLELLLLHSGLERRLRADAAVDENFNKVISLWQVEGRNAIRYADPANPIDADSFWRLAGDEKVGVLPWLRSHL